ncbi:ABC transporter ATP-binding protein/permease [Candidatus Magnetobacterium bavaricum]|uniref:ABC transporter ATP-binding protein/permease n=1 Tax=Candidatus Magnetobacterium bavaricum TaxID=29290 RepID=A0A0F3GHP9_9BACT|nr:ABC transporter ATP-binding protein/permease [Candidatus Magnetobacterium bavaricum]
MKMPNLQKIRRILSRKEQLNILIIIFLYILFTISEVISISVIIPIIGLFIKPSMITSSETLRTLYLWSRVADPLSFLMLLVIVAIFIFTAKSIYGIIILYVQQKYISTLNIRLSTHILHEYMLRPYEFHLLNNSSVLFKNVNVEVSQFTSGYLSNIILIVTEAIVLLGLLSFVIYLYPIVATITILCIGLVVIGLNAILNRKMARCASDRSFYSELYYRKAMESLQSVKEIKVFGVYDFFLKQYSKAFGIYMRSVIKSNIIAIIPRYFLETLLFFCILLVILISAYNKANLHEIVSMMAIFVIVSIRLMPSVYKINQSVTLAHYSSNSLEIVYDIIVETETTNKKTLIPITTINDDESHIRFDNISFSYSAGQQNIVNNCNVTIIPNAITAFVGKTGTGKSTIIDIAMGLLLPQQGSLYYGNMEITEATVDIYRTKIGYVPQTIILIDDTIAANIAFGLPQTCWEESKLNLAVEIAQLKTFIEELSEGLMTVVGERGVRISGGQRQRIGIARAFYRDPEIMVFDEATSAIDVSTEERIYKAVKKLNKTVILVTHRPVTLNFADVIYVLDNGSISKQERYVDREPLLKHDYVLGA